MTGMSQHERRRYFRRMKRSQNGISLGPRWFVYPTRGRTPKWCMGCGRTIPADEAHASGTSSGRVCEQCFREAQDVSPETMALLMDGAADGLRGRISIVAIQWCDDVTSEDIHRLSRAWASKIDEKSVVAATRIRIYGNRRLVGTIA